MKHYCTIFDKNYLYQAVTLYNSLKKYEEFYFYTLCMDPISFEVMSGLNLDKCIVIDVNQLITPEVEEVRNRTSFGQFCWICQPLLCSYILKSFEVDMITYLESDSMFFSNPEVLFEELGENSVSLVPHNYTPKYDQSKISGEFCVQFNVFRNDTNSIKVLDYWRESCFKYTKTDSNYLPGQLCLDKWHSLFNGVKSIKNIGAGVAPWNINSFQFKKNDNVFYVNDSPIIFYHFHHFGRYLDGRYELGYYPLPKPVVVNIYGKYITELAKAENLVKQIFPDFNYQKIFLQKGIRKISSIKDIKAFIDFSVDLIKRKLKNRYNVFETSYFNFQPKQ